VLLGRHRVLPPPDLRAEERGSKEQRMCQRDFLPEVAEGLSGWQNTARSRSTPTSAFGAFTTPQGVRCRVDDSTCRNPHQKPSQYMCPRTCIPSAA
jgi:hypothetical protein